MLLPGMGDIQMHRFVMGVDLAGILIAGVGLAWILRQASVLLVRFAPRYGAAARGRRVGADRRSACSPRPGPGAPRTTGATPR